VPDAAQLERRRLQSAPGWAPRGASPHHREPTPQDARLRRARRRPGRLAPTICSKPVQTL